MESNEPHRAGHRASRPKMWALSSVLLASSLMLTGCINQENLEATPDGGSAPTHVAEVTFPDTEAGRRSEWVVEQLNGNRAINRRNWYDKVSPQLQERVPVDSLVGTLNADLRPQGPFVASAYSEPEPNTAVFTLTPNLTHDPVQMTIELDAGGLINDIWYINQAEVDNAFAPVPSATESS